MAWTRILRLKLSVLLLLLLLILPFPEASVELLSSARGEAVVVSCCIAGAVDRVVMNHVDFTSECGIIWIRNMIRARIRGRGACSVVHTPEPDPDLEDGCGCGAWDHDLPGRAIDGLPGGEGARRAARAAARRRPPLMTQMGGSEGRR